MAKHPHLKILSQTKDSVTAGLRSWEGPVEAGEIGREVWSPPATFPRDQGFVESLAQRHAIGYDKAGQRVATVSQSVSYWQALSNMLVWRVVPRSPIVMAPYNSDGQYSG